jgi:hypothetical protein
VEVVVFKDLVDLIVPRFRIFLKIFSVILEAALQEEQATEVMI